MPTVILIGQGSLVLLVFAVGLQSGWQDLFHVVRQPRLFLSGLLAVNVIVPTVMIAMVLLLPIAPITRAGLVAMAIAPLAPLLPAKMLQLGADQRYAVGLYVALIVAAILLVPATLWAIGRFTGNEFGLTPGPLARLVLASVLAPLIAGMSVAALWPQLAARLSRPATIVAFIILLPIVLLLLVKSAGQMASLFGDGTLLAIAVTVLVGMASGHALGGPEQDNRRAMAQAAVTRHPGIAAMIINGNAIDKQAMLAVILYLFASLAISTFYARRLAARMPAATGDAANEAT
jgi:BASS family bile acid:Na+ symporter